MQASLKANPRSAGPQRPALRGRAQVVRVRRTATKTATYVCLDCGWVYDGSKGPFEDLPSSFRCPVCLSPKRRFRKQEPAAASNGRGGKARLSATDGKLDEGDKQLFATAAVGAAVLLAGLYFYLSSQTSL